METHHELTRGYCYDYHAGYAVIESCFDTSPLGVKLHHEGCGILNASQCRMLAAFLKHAARWLDETRANKALPSGTIVYLLTDGTGHFKVGKAVNVGSRIKQLQTGNGRRLVLFAYLPCSSETIAYQAESRVKRWLEPYKATGEWFLCEPETAAMALHEVAGRMGFEYEPIQMLEDATDGPHPQH
jgi:predicted GIY-YIG superfamily endonuclease